jgi:hypothetical protein
MQEPLPHVSLAWTPGDQVHHLQPWLDAFKHEPIALKVGGLQPCWQLLGMLFMTPAVNRGA